MKAVKVGAGLLAAGLMAGAHADVVTMSQNFDNFAGLSAAGWVFTNNSADPNLSWFAGNSGIFGAQSGAPGSYAAANFNSTNSATGVIDNWLISPMFVLGSSPTLEFYTQGADEGFFDMLEVRYSSGASSAVSTFTTLLATIGDGFSQQYPTGGWAHYSLALPMDVAGRIGFRYVSSNASNADYIGIDTVSASATSVTTPVPEPGTFALIALGLAGVAGAARRRKQSVSTPLPA